MKRVLVGAAIIFVILIGLLAGCVKEEPIVSATFADGAFKQIYDLDEELNADKIKIKITYQRGKTEEEEIDISEVTGFDTATTGKKKLTANYQSFTLEWDYEVVYSHAPVKSVLTSARLSLTQHPYPTGIGRGININIGDLTKISAVYFTVRGKQDFADADFSRMELKTVDGLGYRLFYVNARTVSAIIFTYGTSIAESGELASLNFVGKGDQAVYLTDITVSDGRTDYYLPETEEV